MHVFYVDEAGCTGTLPTGTSPIQPVFVLGCIIVEQPRLRDFTLDWLHLKDRFFPGLQIPNSDFLDWIAVEIKGANLRRRVREGKRDPRRQALGFMDKFLDLLDTHHARLLARLYVKPIGAPFNGRSVYTSAVQSLASDFQQFLAANNSTGLMVLDSRNKPKNTNVSHSVFTQKFRAAGDAYAGLIEMPVFGHSDNHAGIQAADLICSAFLFPMAAYVYCLGHVNNLHVHLQYYRIRDRYGKRLKQMQFRYQDADHWWRGGITVSDAISRQSGGVLFAP
ncbi:MAG TPA: DUF3800 domain-containing protein [Verrucomicrobiae bacterium]|nr:DUF3800 domain-containing protein [Verrucomicrobiae bacterium]